MYVMYCALMYWLIVALAEYFGCFFTYFLYLWMEKIGYL